MQWIFLKARWIFAVLLFGFFWNAGAQTIPSVCSDSSYHFSLSSIAPAPDSLRIFCQIKTKDGGLLLTGNQWLAHGAGFGFIARMDSNGALRWCKRVLSNPYMGSPVFKTVNETPDGNILLVASLGGLYAETPFLLIVFNADGATLRQQAIGFKKTLTGSNVAYHADLLLPYKADSLLLVAWAQTSVGGGQEKYILLPISSTGRTGIPTVLTPPVQPPACYLPFFNGGGGRWFCANALRNWFFYKSMPLSG